MPLITTLLSNMNYDAIITHIHVLVSIISSNIEIIQYKQSNNKEDSPEDSMEVDEVEQGSDLENITEIIAVLDALVLLTKNTSIANRGLVCYIITTILARLSIFNNGIVTFPMDNSSNNVNKSDTKKKKRKGSSGDLNESAFIGDLNTPVDYYTALLKAYNTTNTTTASTTTIPMLPAAVTAITILDQSLSKCSVPDQLATAAGSKLLSLLADQGTHTLTYLDQQSKQKATTTTEHNAENNNNNEEISDNTKSPSLLFMTWYSVWCMHSSGLPLRVVEVADAEEGIWEDFPGLLHTIHVLFNTKANLTSTNTNTTAGTTITSTNYYYHYYYFHYYYYYYYYYFYYYYHHYHH